MERRLTANAVRYVCGLRWGQPAVVRLYFDPVSFPTQRITTHLLRLLNSDERRRQTLDCHKLHLWWVAAEDDALGIALLIRHASGFSVHGDDVLVFGPVLDQGVQGGCEVDGIVHINCSSSRVRHRHTQRQPAAASASPIPSPPPAPLKHSSSRHKGQGNLVSVNPFTSTSPTVGGNFLLYTHFSRPPRQMPHQPMPPLDRSTATNASSFSRSCGRV